MIRPLLPDSFCAVQGAIRCLPIPALDWSCLPHTWPTMPLSIEFPPSYIASPVSSCSLHANRCVLMACPLEREDGAQQTPTGRFAVLRFRDLFVISAFRFFSIFSFYPGS